MEEDRLISALQRLARAVSQLEDARAPLVPADSDEVERLRARVDQASAHQVAAEESLRQLSQRHQRLRASAAEAVARLGELIG